jgi:hypothetical protein
MDKKLLCFGAVRPTYGVVLSTGLCKEGNELLAVVWKFVSSLNHFA